MVALAGYMACEQIARALLKGAVLPSGVDRGEHVVLHISPIRPDFRSIRSKKDEWIQCPWPGNWTERVHVDPESWAQDHGLYLDTDWRGAFGSTHTFAMVAARPEDMTESVMSWGGRLMLASQIAVLGGVDVSHLAKRGLLAGADMHHVELGLVDLSFADLSGANLSRAGLGGTSLVAANLRGANLADAYLHCANLFLAHLEGADLSGADLSSANLKDVDWDETTVWPDGFVPPEKRVDFCCPVD